jgi:putative PEP-CTERM system histidine kinase
MLMTITTAIAFSAAGAAVLLAIAAVFRRPSSLTSWLFFSGMLLLAAQSVLYACGTGAETLSDVIWWNTLALTVKSFVPGVWLCFSLVYARGNYQEFLASWRTELIAAALIPPILVFGSGSELYQVAEIEGVNVVKFTAVAKVLNGLILVASVLVLTNFEKTFRAAIGILRWRIKFAILGLGLIFGASIYTRSEAILFSIPSPNLGAIEAGALLVGCLLIPVAYVRRGLAEADVYPSREVLQGSLTLTLAGGYLLVVGVLAQVVVRLGGTESFQSQVLIVLVGIAILTVLLTSDRVRQFINRFVTRHFKRPRHNYGKVWTQFTQRTSGILDQTALCSNTAHFISETFDTLSVTIWLVDEERKRLEFGASTGQKDAGVEPTGLMLSDEAVREYRALDCPLDLEESHTEWSKAIGSVTRSHFPNGGHRLCVPLTTGERRIGVLSLADRVNGNPYALDELDLIECIGSQVAAGLLKVRLARELMQAKELEAFQTMSAFFVHDLKNAASSLGLMLENLPTHFDDPEFREDALRGLGSAVRRITEFIDRLGSLRRKMEMRP